MGQRKKNIYTIRIRGQLDQGWSSWFEGLNIETEGDNITRLTGFIVDESALHGILKKIRDLGLPLLSITSGESQE